MCSTSGYNRRMSKVEYSRIGNEEQLSFDYSSAFSYESTQSYSSAQQFNSQFVYNRPGFDQPNVMFERGRFRQQND